MLRIVVENSKFLWTAVRTILRARNESAYDACTPVSRPVASSERLAGGNCITEGASSTDARSPRRHSKPCWPRGRRMGAQQIDSRAEPAPRRRLGAASRLRLVAVPVGERCGLAVRRADLDRHVEMLREVDLARIAG